MAVSYARLHSFKWMWIESWTKHKCWPEIFELNEWERNGLLPFSYDGHGSTGLEKNLIDEHSAFEERWAQIDQQPGAVLSVSPSLPMIGKSLLGVLVSWVRACPCRRKEERFRTPTHQNRFQQKQWRRIRKSLLLTWEFRLQSLKSRFSAVSLKDSYINLFLHGRDTVRRNCPVLEEMMW